MCEETAIGQNCFPTAGRQKPHLNPWPEMKTPKHSASKPQPTQPCAQAAREDHCMSAVHSVTPLTGRLSVVDKASDQVAFPWSGYDNRLTVSISAQMAPGSTHNICKISMAKEMCRPSLQTCLKKETA